MKSRRGAAEIASILRGEIERGRYTRNERFPAERVLSEEFDVARGTVREALSQLANEGLVEIRRGSGAYVLQGGWATSNSAITEARPLELMDARFALEPHVCRLAVLHARQRDFERAEQLLMTMEESVHDQQAFSEADSKFHNLLVEATGNGLLMWIVEQISSVRHQEQWSRMLRVTLDEKTIMLYNSQHRQILNAIRTREPERAALLMKEHLETARLTLTRTAST
ncbi:MAG: FadR/GntR family transcriptional regulator [Pseudomonadota bacterium]